jgi:hypothetical protein
MVKVFLDTWDNFKYNDVWYELASSGMKSLAAVPRLDDYVRVKLKPVATDIVKPMQRFIWADLIVGAIRFVENEDIVQIILVARDGKLLGVSDV